MQPIVADSNANRTHRIKLRIRDEGVNEPSKLNTYATFATKAKQLGQEIQGVTTTGMPRILLAATDRWNLDCRDASCAGMVSAVNSIIQRVDDIYFITISGFS